MSNKSNKEVQQIMDKKQLEQLKAPFPIAAHYWKPGATTKDKKRALGLTYVDSRQYQTRLDQVDPAWTISYTPSFLDGRILVNCKLTVMGITREDVGECASKDNNAYTSAVAQAFKRTCAQFGLGRYLYDVPQVWAAYDGGRKRFSEQGLKALRQSLVAAVNGKGNGNGTGGQSGRTQQKAQLQPKAQPQAEAKGNGKGNGELAIPAVSDAVTARARAVALSFGKHNGKTLGEALDADAGYIEWLAEKAQDAKVRAAAKYLMQLATPGTAKPSGNGQGAAKSGGKAESNGKSALAAARAVAMPFGTRNHPEYKDKTLSEIEKADPGMVDWLADKAKSPWLKDAASLVVASRS